MTEVTKADLRTVVDLTRQLAKVREREATMAAALDCALNTMIAACVPAHVGDRKRMLKTQQKIRAALSQEPSASHAPGRYVSSWERENDTYDSGDMPIGEGQP